jgi:hypothetical protein
MSYFSWNSKVGKSPEEAKTPSPAQYLRKNMLIRIDHNVTI